MTIVTALRLEPAEDDQNYFAYADDQQVTLQALDDQSLSDYYHGRDGRTGQTIHFPVSHLGDVLSALYELFTKRGTSRAQQTQLAYFAAAQTLQAEDQHDPFGNFPVPFDRADV